MNKPTVVFTRKIGWEREPSNVFRYVYVPVAGWEPRRKNGRPAGDEAMTAATKEGISLLVRTLKKYKAEILITWVHTKMGRDVWKLVRKASPKTKWFFCDGNEPTRVCDWAERLMGMYDVFVINSDDPRTKKLYRQRSIPVETLWDAVEPVNHPAPGPIAEYDCLFAGSNHVTKYGWEYDLGKVRYEVVRRAAREFNIAIHGSPREWRGVRARFLPIKYAGEYFRALHASRIVLGCNQCDLHRYYGRRMWHSCASGRLHLTRVVRGMREDGFVDGKTIATFEDPDDAMKKIRRYLEDRKTREKLAAAQRAHVLANHAWMNRRAEFEAFAGRYL